MKKKNKPNTHTSPSRGKVQLSPVKVVAIVFFGEISLWILLEFLAFKYEWHLWPLLRDKLASVSGWMSAAVVIALKFIWQLFSGGNGKVSLTRPEGMGTRTHLKILLRYLINDCIMRNTILITGVVIAFLLVVPSYAADHQWGQRLKDWASTPAVSDKGGEDAPALPDGTPSDDAPALPNDTPSNDDQNIVSTDGAEEYPNQDSNPTGTNSQEELSETVKRISARDLLLDAEKPAALTSEEYNQIFFSSDDSSDNHIIKDWTSKNSVEEAVHNFVEDKLTIQSSPNYDMAGISQSVRDSIALASKKEANTKTATELIKVINIRKNAYGEPEKGKKEVDTNYSLAKLVRESYGYYGDAFNFQEASDSAAYALYGRSIIWGFKTLNYASGTDNFIKDLEIIAERYEKITEVVSADTSEFLYAGLLRDAFTNEANSLK